jgi:hypothetical protein
MYRYTRSLPLTLWLLTCQTEGRAASWTKLTNPAPSAAETMLLLTDGTIMIEQGDNQQWMRLVPDPQGSYINGGWDSNLVSKMSVSRLYFASQVLPSGKVWVVGGEYTGKGLPKNWSATGEIFDPVSGLWAAIAPFPTEPNCVLVSWVAGAITSGSPVITNLPSTAGWQAGWSVTEARPKTGIPPNTVIQSGDSPTQIIPAGPPFVEGCAHS